MSKELSYADIPASVIASIPLRVGYMGFNEDGSTFVIWPEDADYEEAAKQFKENFRRLIGCG